MVAYCSTATCPLRESPGEPIAVVSSLSQICFPEPVRHAAPCVAAWRSGKVITRP